MHRDLEECIETARIARDRLLSGRMTVKEANSVAANNHTVISAHALDLRERIFVAETERPDARVAKLGDGMQEEDRG